MSKARYLTGTHAIFHPNGMREICDCGPVNLYSGPQWAVIGGTEYRHAVMGV